MVRLFWAIGAMVLLVAGLVWVALSTEVAARKLIALGLARSGTGHHRPGQRAAARPVRAPAGSQFTTEALRATWTACGSSGAPPRYSGARSGSTGSRWSAPRGPTRLAPASRDTTKPERPRLPVDVVLGDVALLGLSVDGPAGAYGSGAARFASLVGRTITAERPGRRLAPKLEKVHLQLAAGGNLERLIRARAEPTCSTAG